MKIRFLSDDNDKIMEAKSILENGTIEILPFKVAVDEIQTVDTMQLVKDKIMKAFNIIGRPIFCEHTGLYMDYLNGLPGGLTEVFWETLKPEKFSELFGRTIDPSVKVRTVIGYCDGKAIHYFQDEIAGRISEIPTRDCEGRWESVFIPEGHDRTFSELKNVENMLCMRKKALYAFSEYLGRHSKW